MQDRKGLYVLVMLALLMSLLPIGAAAQELAAQVGAAPQWVKPGDTLPDGKQPPDDTPGLPLDFVAGSEAVATGYGWSQASGTYTEITGGTVHGVASNDDTGFPAVNLGFTFTYDNVAYTQVSIQSNGFVAMGATVTSSYTPLSTGSTNNVVAILGRDLQGNGTTSELMSLMEGSAPNRVFTVQWKHYKRYGTAYAGDDFNFQIKLYETSNVVEYVYGPFTAVYNAAPPTVQVGIRGASNTDFNNRTSTGSWSSSAAGATNAATMALTDVYYPPSGLTWDWTPLPPTPFLGTSYKTAPAQAVVGDSLAYVVHIVNSGTAAANAATMVDPIPAGTTYNGDVTCSAGTCGFDGTNVTWAGTVAVGAEVTVSFSVDSGGVACGTIVQNQATLADPALAGGPVTRSASTTLVGSTPTVLEGFEVSVPPPGWTETIVVDPGTDPDWSWETAGTYPTIAPHGGTRMAKFNSFSQNGGIARLWTNALDLSGYAAPAVVFWMSHDTGYTTNADRIQIQVSTDGTTWVDVGAPILRYDAAYTTPGWGEHAVALPAGYNVNGVYIGFLGISAYGNNFYLDDTALSEGWYPCPYLTLAPDATATGCLSSTVSHTLTLTNMSPDGDTFDLTVAGNAWPTTPSPAQLALGPGASGQVTVSVDLPSTPGSDTAVVTALGQTLGGTDTATLATTGATTYWEPIATEPNNGRMDHVLGSWGGYAWSITGYGADRDVRTYDPATDTWTVVGTPPTFLGNYARSGCQDGSKVYMYGDASTAGFTGLWSYDMATTTWAQETPGGTAPVPTGIWAPAWAHDAETGYCYLTGGATVAGAGNLTTVYVYDPATNAWLAQLPDFTTVRDFHAAWVFTDNTARKLLCVAGGNGATTLASTQCYDFVAGTWGAENADMGPLPADLWGMGYAQKDHEGVTQLWVTGGVRAGLLTAATSFFDVAADVWADDGDLASGAVYRTSAVTLDNEIYNLGGSIGSFTYTGLASHHVQCGAPADIDVSPLSLGATQPPNTTTGQVLTIANVGAADLTWAVGEDVRAPSKRVDWSDNFDAYATGSQLHGQGGWKGWGNDPAGGALTSSAQNRSAPNSADIAGASDLVHEYVATDGLWVYTAWQFIPTSFTGTSYFILLNQYDDAGTTNNWSTQVNFDAATNLVTNDGPAGGTLPFTRNAWVEIRVVIDLVADTQAFYYGNQLLFQGSWSAGQSGGGITSIGAVDLYANGASSVYYDDISLVEHTVACSAVTDIPWLSSSATAGTTPPAGSTPVDVLYNSTGLADGVYTANLCVSSNDPDPGPGNGTDLVVLPVTLTVETPAAPSISLVKTVGTTPGVCSPDTAITVPAGTTVYYCYTATNTGSVAFPTHDLTDDQLGTIFTGLSYSLTPGSSVNTVAAGLSISAVITTTTTNIGTWTAHDATGAPTQATASATVTVDTGVPSITLSKTVGTVPGVCAATNSVTVTTGTDVYYCFVATNTGTVTFEFHDLVDDHLGTVLAAFPYTLAPGASSPEVIIPDTVAGPVVNTATWTASSALGSYTMDDTIAVNFEDIAATGTAVTLTDDSTATFPIGFSFDFYGTTYTDFWVSSNGFLATDGANNGCCSGQNLPNPSAPNGVIAGWWDDMNPSAGGTHHYQVLGSAPNRRLIFQVTDVPHYSSGNLVTLQYKLYETTNVIEVHYLAAPNDGSSHTAGIENQDGTVAALYYYGAAALTTPLAIRYAPTVPQQASAVATATVNVNDPDITVNPASLLSAQLTGTVVTLPLDLGNVGGIDLTWTLEEEPVEHSFPTIQQPVGPGDPSQAAELASEQPESKVPDWFPEAVTWSGPELVLYDNGPLVTHPGGGGGGADASALQPTLAMSTYGTSCSLSTGYRVADDVVITDPAGWAIDTITFFAYQTGSTTTSTLNALSLQIWDGPPNDPASTVVWGDTTTNILSSSTWTNIYRVTDTTLTTTNRPIMSAVGTVNHTLPAGTYWLDWQVGGTLASGPWAPAITVLGQTTTGNALQQTVSTGAWAAFVDVGPQGLPFIIDGQPAICGNLADVPWLSASPTSGTIAPSGTQQVSVTFDSTGLALGLYEATLCVFSNDPDEPVVPVPVAMEVVIPVELQSFTAE